MKLDFDAIASTLLAKWWRGTLPSTEHTLQYLSHKIPVCEWRLGTNPAPSTAWPLNLAPTHLEKWQTTFPMIIVLCCDLTGTFYPSTVPLEWIGNAVPRGSSLRTSQ